MIGRVSPPILMAATAAILLSPGGAAQGTCNVLGEVFVTNPFDPTLMIKDDGSADINTVRFSNQTEFVHVTVERRPAGAFDPKSLQAGDRLCVQFAAADPKAAARILVMKRLEIQEHQKQVFAALARNSSFGIVTELNAQSRTIELKEELGGGASQAITVEASDPVAFRYYSPDAYVGKDGVASNWDRLHVGDYIYVQGRRDPASQEIRAGLIIEGGVKGIVGTIVSMNGMGEVIELRELGTGNLQAVQIRRDAVFRASPFIEAAIPNQRDGSSAAWDLHPISFSDLQKGDTIGVLAKEDGDLQDAVAGLTVVTGFGSYGISALPPGAPAFWFIDPFKAAQ